MTDEEFALGVEAILLTRVQGHAVHRALDLWWARYAAERGGPLAEATAKWMAHIHGDHDGGLYPLGRRWWQVGPLRPRPVTVPAQLTGYEGWTCP